MDEERGAQIVEQLRSSQGQQAWAEFLQFFSPLLLQVISLFERSDDSRADCFLFVCEQLRRKGFRKLRCYRPSVSSRFSNWLRVVVRNLCLDWRRKELGRHRVFKSIARLNSLDREVFDCVYERGLSKEEAFLFLQGRHTGLEREQIGNSLDRIHAALTPRQLWLLSTRNPTIVSLETGSSQTPDGFGHQIPDPCPDPEALLSAGELQEAVMQALQRLSEPERLLIRLRFEEEITLQEIAELLDLEGTQAVDRRIGEIVEKLQKELGSGPDSRGKTGSVSV